MNNKYTDKINEVLQYSKEEALRLQNNYIGPEHLMLGILRDGENKASNILISKCNLDLTKLRKSIEKSIEDNSIGLNYNNISLNDLSRRILHLSILESRLLHSPSIDVEHLLLAIMKQNNNIPAQILKNNNISYKQIYDYLKLNLSNSDNSVSYDENDGFR